MGGRWSAPHGWLRGALVGALVLFVAPAIADTCPALRETELKPVDLAACAALEPDIRRPGALPMQAYQEKLGRFLRAYCHRNPAAGWVTDKKLRDTGPFVGHLASGPRSGVYHGTHAPVVVWYSPDMYAWMKENRPDHSEFPEDKAPVPDGAVMVKEMFPPPGARCAGEDPMRLEPTSGAAVMVRAAEVSHDGWFWGWFGWKDWQPDWPAKTDNAYPNMGFGQYCTNCHASAKSNGTFASLKNVKGHPGEPLVFLSQRFFQDQNRGDNHHVLVAMAIASLGQTEPSRPDYHPEFLRVFGGARPGVKPNFDTVSRLPPETYDNVWAIPGSKLANSFVTSDQCLGCHAAGSTGLQYDMAEPTVGGTLRSFSPWAQWRSSPMGLSGRDPFFYAQVESETTHFHPESKKLIEDTCFGCHGIGGQRQHAMENAKPDGTCTPFERAMVDATPLEGDAKKAHARFGALARDGITCLACHRMAIGDDAAKHASEPQNACIAGKQERLNHELKGFAKTFTGAFPIASPDRVFGPFAEPKEVPMKNGIGMIPQHRQAMTSSEVCGSCHTVHLPILKEGRVIGHAYEQATYAEWLFSAYRTGTGITAANTTAPLPHGRGEAAQSCQDCHMPDKDGKGRALASKVASIQEYSTFPQTENVLPAKEIDLPVRQDYSRHTLVGLNVWLIKMAQQFSEVLGNRGEDPMLSRKGVSPLLVTEEAMLDQAANRTADISVSGVARSGGRLRARVTIRNKAGHKFPSGVGFRRAFVAFTVRDKSGRELWASGRTDAMGVLQDERGRPLAGELWWDAECKARIAPERREHLPHFRTIRRQGEVQIYQELVAAPGEGTVCGDHAPAQGPLTTSFLSVCKRVKDNRILPHGYLPLAARREVAAAIGADDKLAEETGSVGVGDDPDYAAGGQDMVEYDIPLADMSGAPASVEAVLYYQAQPPFYLQDRFCTAKGRDADRLFLLAGFLKQSGTESADWKLRLVSTGRIPVR
jgi:hypothetical protein